MHVRGTMLALTSSIVIAASPHSAIAQQSRNLPTPASILGFEPGADRHLPSWKQITDYFTALDKASPRVTVRTIGKTVLGRPFVVAIISDSSTLANLEHYRQIQRKLMDPRLQAAGERDKLLAEGKNVILVTSAIHSTESGGFTTPLVLADRLARAADPEAKEILANSIILMVPSQNPDGVDIVGDYYRSTLGTANEGREPPELYHHYVGHDDNRDWYAFTQPETRATVDSLYTPWDPQIVNDIHQQGSNTSRIFIPPYMDPVEPNIDPILTAATNGLGMAMVWRMTNQGFTGIASNATYDQWSPARQYSLYHRGARLLTETASARLASPIDLTFEQLGTGRGYDARVVSWNYPSLWTGGHWTYGDIVRYQVAASWALFLDASQNRRAWLEGYAAMADRALGPQPAWGKDPWPSAVVIPKTQPDTQALRRMIWTLQHGQVEIREATAPVTVDGKSYPTGSYVVLTKQPRQLVAGHQHDAFEQLAFHQAALREIFPHAVDRHVLAHQRRKILRGRRRLRLPPGAEHQAGSILFARDVVHGISREQHTELRARAAHRVRDPDHRVVLFLGRCAVRGLDDLQHFHDRFLISSG